MGMLTLNQTLIIMCRAEELSQDAEADGDISCRYKAVMEAARPGDHKLSGARKAEIKAFICNTSIASATMSMCLLDRWYNLGC